ncbi:predicted protein [Scheffersomyces stipitis CBS 6054]|uniref:Uncharacterized protein n=1 Tax=Scheffersomyces stipitis (strain ATCC 58785 / CBS 6054 / NBRC 10063 / NRRL Y-11545) TaxID=322104 RepID=A3LZR5_PICST|nr:predicted protein [Scheffersomyces stipitis CBS 6054]ABN68589.2 predicted protein [Scheffersomyces stipitis CBS 6054]
MTSNFQRIPARPSRGDSTNKDVPPPSIVTAVAKQQDRLYLLRLEKDLIAFINALNNSVSNESEPEPEAELKASSVPETGAESAPNPQIRKTTATDPEYTIKAHFLRNSYYRLLSHQLCHYYRLGHWNNTSNEIVVTRRDGVNYVEFGELLAKDSDNRSFRKVSEISQRQLHHGQDQEGSSTTAGVEGESSNTEASGPIKPKVLIKKNDSVKNETPTPIDEASSLQTTPVPVDSNVSTPSEVSISDSSKMESERASKEALYNKIREQIFQGGQDDEDEDEADIEEDERAETEYHTINNYNNNNNVNVNFNKYSNNDIDEYQQDVYGNYNNSGSGGYGNTSSDVNPGFMPYNPMGMSIQMPINYSAQPFNAANGFYPPPSHPGRVGPIPPSRGSVPIGYPPNFYGAPMMSPQGYYGYGAMPLTAPPYDKDTERRLLNNPYIIIPDDNILKNKSKKYKKPYYKNNQYYGDGYNGNNNNGNIGSSSNDGSR